MLTSETCQEQLKAKLLNKTTGDSNSALKIGTKKWRWQTIKWHKQKIDQTNLGYELRHLVSIEDIRVTSVDVNKGHTVFRFLWRFKENNLCWCILGACFNSERRNLGGFWSTDKFIKMVFVPTFRFLEAKLLRVLKSTTDINIKLYIKLPTVLFSRTSVKSMLQHTSPALWELLQNIHH